MKKNPYILYIDDDSDDCVLLQEAINRHNSDVALECIHSGDKAVDFLTKAIASNELPGVIILDMNMPGMDGRATLMEIRKVLSSTTPIMFLTTTPRNTDINFGDRNGVTLFAKPTNIAGYNDLVTTILNLFF